MKDYKKKLIEVSLPLNAINKESAREKSIRHGHPSTLHLWWARRPLAACRAVLFAQLVDDPSAHPNKFPTEEDQNCERKRLFGIIEELVRWENINNEEVLTKARKEILKSTSDNPPPIFDPFCGGGSIPLEAQRLGLEAHASDLNPVAVLITKALIEIPPKFAGRPPVHPGAQQSISWKGAKGLSEDLEYYGKWMRDVAEKRIGHLYPNIKLPKKNGHREAAVVAWLWTRMIKCQNPACGVQMPLAKSFWLSKRKKNKAWIEPLIDKTLKKIEFQVRTGEGQPQSPPKIARGAKFRCLLCGQVADAQYIKDEGCANRIKNKLLAIVCSGNQGLFYVSPSQEHEDLALSIKSNWSPDAKLAFDPRAIWCTLYGLKQFGDLFTRRQLTALNTFSELIAEAREQIRKDAKDSGCEDDGKPLEKGGKGATAYADAISTYLALALGRSANYWSSLTPWGGSFIVQTFGRQALPMVWDFAEANIFSESTGNWIGAIDWIKRCLVKSIPNAGSGSAKQADAVSSDPKIRSIICTDPPYYDNIGYADLADYFYVWLRRPLSSIYPNLFTTLLTPKESELVAIPYRFGNSRDKARQFFEEGLNKVFVKLKEVIDDGYPITIYYAFKQAEIGKSIKNGDKSISVISTGWETMLSSLLQANYQITGTWPIRTERDQGLKTGTNVLASSIVLVCRSHSEKMPLTTRRDFINNLRQELPEALKTLKKGNIAPVDFVQAAIGPGMAIFSKYSKIIEADGTTMDIRSALTLINQVLDEYLTEQEAEYDAETGWALAWFEQHGLEEGPFGTAETLSKAKNTAIESLVKFGILEAKGGKVRLLSRGELPDSWNDTSTKRITVWNVTQYLIKVLVDKGSEEAAADLLNKIGALGETARDLSYRLYNICDRKKWAQEALAYNSLVIAWPELVKLAAQKEISTPIQQDLF